MTEEQFKKAEKLYERLRQLEEVKNEIRNDDYHKGSLTYKSMGGDFGSKWEIVAHYVMLSIAGILDRHDKQIRQEIDEEIKKLKKQIEIL